MKLISRLYIFLVLILILSCSSKKSIVYLNEFNESDPAKFLFQDHIISPGDILKIDILTENAFSNSKLSSNNINQSNRSRESLIFDGFIVDNSGYIDFPSVGKIKV